MHTDQSSLAPKKIRPRSRTRARKQAASETTIRILEGEGGESVLEVETSDRSGFMGGLSLALIQHSVQILRAEVRRVGGGAVDRFVLAERDGSPISPAKWLALQVVVLSAIEAALRST